MARRRTTETLIRLDPPANGPTNMARDAELLISMGSSGVSGRLYSWSGPWVTLGRFQNPETDLLPNCKVPHAMRPTGGRAVLHGHDLTLGLAVHFRCLKEPDEAVEAVSRSVRRAYRGVVGPIVQALRSCGVDACLGESIVGMSRGPRSADCFSQVSSNDVVDRQSLKKVCGVAMLLSPIGVLVQASIPIGPPLVDPSTVYAVPSHVSWREIDAGRFASALDEALAMLPLE